MNIQPNYICLGCHQSSFHLDPEYYRICSCESSPFICTYCCLTSIFYTQSNQNHCYCTECGNHFSKQMLQNKAKELKYFEVQSKNMVGFNQNRVLSGGQFFNEQIFSSNIYQSNQGYINQYPPINFAPNCNQNYDIQQQKYSINRRQSIPYMTEQQNSSLAQSFYFSPIHNIDSSMSEGVLDAYNITQQTSSKVSESSKQFSNGFNNSSLSLLSNHKNFSNGNEIFGSGSQRDNIQQDNFDYYQNQDTINQPWMFNQQNNRVTQNQQNNINPFQQTSEQQYGMNGFNQQNGVMQQNNFNFPQNISTSQQKIQESINTQYYQNQSQVQQNQMNQQPNNIFEQFNQQQNHSANNQIQQFSQQSTIIDDNTINNLNNFQIFPKEEINQNRQTEQQQQNSNNHMKYIQNIPQAQKINTHLYQSLELSQLQQNRSQQQNLIGQRENNLQKSHVFGQNAEYLTPKQFNRSKSVQYQKSLSLNDLADKSLNNSINLDDIIKKNQPTQLKKETRQYISNQELAEKFRGFNQLVKIRSISRDCQQILQQQQNKPEKSNEGDIYTQFQREKEQILQCRGLFRNNQQQDIQDDISSQNSLDLNSSSYQNPQQIKKLQKQQNSVQNSQQNNQSNNYNNEYPKRDQTGFDCSQNLYINQRQQQSNQNLNQSQFQNQNLNQNQFLNQSQLQNSQQIQQFSNQQRQQPQNRQPQLINQSQSQFFYQQKQQQSQNMEQNNQSSYLSNSSNPQRYQHSYMSQQYSQSQQKNSKMEEM